jgi:hypothetical protein
MISRVMAAISITDALNATRHCAILAESLVEGIPKSGSPRRDRREGKIGGSSNGRLN